MILGHSQRKIWNAGRLTISVSNWNTFQLQHNHTKNTCPVHMVMDESENTEVHSWVLAWEDSAEHQLTWIEPWWSAYNGFVPYAKHERGALGDCWRKSLRTDRHWSGGWITVITESLIQPSWCVSAICVINEMQWTEGTDLSKRDIHVHGERHQQEGHSTNVHVHG